MVTHADDDSLRFCHKLHHMLQLLHPIEFLLLIIVRRDIVAVAVEKSLQLADTLDVGGMVRYQNLVAHP